MAGRPGLSDVDEPFAEISPTRLSELRFAATEALGASSELLPELTPSCSKWTPEPRTAR